MDSSDSFSLQKYIQSSMCVDINFVIVRFKWLIEVNKCLYFWDRVTT